MRLTLLTLTLLLAACAGPKEDTYACHSVMSKGDGRPTVLVIGDSISLGYVTSVRQALPNYDVAHNPCNAYSSHITRERLGYWLSARQSFESITFNNGLWDLSVWLWTSEEEYEANLTYIAERIKEKTARPIFILTTTVPPGTYGRSQTDVLRRNDIARRVMLAEGIPILDLYSVSLTLSGEHVAPNDVHYTAAGYETLGQAVTQELISEGL